MRKTHSAPRSPSGPPKTTEPEPGLNPLLCFTHSLLWRHGLSQEPCSWREDRDVTRKPR